MALPPRNDLPRPFLKWAGGKTQLLGQFEAFYPPAAQIDRYLEPFLGSGAVFLQVQRLIAPNAAILSDGNPALVEVYFAVRDRVEEVVAKLADHARLHGEAHYYRVRAQDPGRLGPAGKAARFIYLNKTCFNGLYRVNSRGRFNVPMGRYVNPPILDPANLRAVSRALHDAEIRAAHFREVASTAKRGDFVYLDPPYHPLSGTASFTSYTASAFGEEDQRELAEVFTALDRKGCRVMLSNSDTSFIAGLYRGFGVHRVQARRSINSKADRRGRIPELVILNYNPPSRPVGAGEGEKHRPGPHPSRNSTKSRHRARVPGGVRIGR